MARRRGAQDERARIRAGKVTRTDTLASARFGIVRLSPLETLPVASCFAGAVSCRRYGCAPARGLTAAPVPVHPTNRRPSPRPSANWQRLRPRRAGMYSRHVRALLVAAAAL